MCECYKIDGPWIAEDPNCPVHGTDARRKERERYKLRKRISEADTIEKLRELLHEVLDLLD